MHGPCVRTPITLHRVVQHFICSSFVFFSFSFSMFCLSVIAVVSVLSLSVSLQYSCSRICYHRDGFYHIILCHRLAILFLCLRLEDKLKLILTARLAGRYTIIQSCMQRLFASMELKSINMCVRRSEEQNCYPLRKLCIIAFHSSEL